MAEKEPERPWAGPRVGRVISFAAGGTFGRHGRVNAETAARRFGVTAGTVRRWAREGIPVKRLAAIEAKILPAPDALEQELRELEYAREALRDLAGLGAPVNPAWRERGWLQPHILAVVQIEHIGVCLARITRAEGDTRSRGRLRDGGGVVIEQEVFPNRFAAQVAKGELLTHLADWRVVMPEGFVARGRTEAWLMEAQRPSLLWLLEHPEVRIPKRRRRPRGKTTTKEQ